MEEPAFMRFMTSPLFTIIVKDADESHNKFLIHSALLASISPSLNILVNGNMREAVEKCVIWQFDKTTVALFGEFAYTGTYNISQKEGPWRWKTMHAWDEPSPWLDVANLYDEEGDKDFPSPTLSETSSVVREEMRSPAPTEPGIHSARDEDDSSTMGICKDYITDECLAHAHLVIFADYFGIDALLDLSLENLTKHLRKIASYSHDVVAELLRRTDEFPDCLHEAISQHIVENIRGLWAHIPLREALQERPSLMTGVIDGLVDEMRE